MPAWISVWYFFYCSELCHRQLVTIYIRHDITNMIEMQQLCFIQYSV